MNSICDLCIQGNIAPDANENRVVLYVVKVIWTMTAFC
jgi:hypothetical protein